MAEDNGQETIEVDYGMEFIDEIPEEEDDPVHQQSDPEWTPEEAEDAYEKTGDDHGDNQPDPM